MMVPSGSSLAFTKVEGLGNDFVLIDTRSMDPGRRAELARRWPALAPRLCHRRLGIGADGLLVLGPPQTAEASASMLVINHDGSRAEMCGNGLRCAALMVARTDGRVVIDTDNGPLPCEVTLTTRVPRTAAVRVEMGLARDGGMVQPASGGGRTFRRVSVGNPHAVTFVEPGSDPESLARSLGPALENDPAFLPARTNVEFAQVTAARRIVTWVWERGCGITQACGTGACAVAFAAGLDRRVEIEGPVTVTLPGGDLAIEVPEQPDRPVVMTGPARCVFAGSLEPDWA